VSGDGGARRLLIHTDGAARGNPGPAGLGAVLREAGDGRETPETAAPILELMNRLSHIEAVLWLAGDLAHGNTDEYVRSRPWTAVGIAAGVGLIIGMLVSRR